MPVSGAFTLPRPGVVACQCLIALFLLLSFITPAHAQTSITILLSSDVEAVHADGHSQVLISIQALAGQTHYTGSLQLSMHTSLGDLDPSVVTLNNGSGTTRLRA